MYHMSPIYAPVPHRELEPQRLLERQQRKELAETRRANEEQRVSVGR